VKAEADDLSLVDALAERLAASEPTALGEGEAVALARAALARSAEGDDEERLVDAAARRLAESEPKPIDDAHARALARESLETANVRAGAGVVELGAMRHAPLLAAAAVMLIVVSATFLARPGEAPVQVHRFASGHRIVVAPGTQLDWEERSDGIEVRLEVGEAMFDVDPDSDELLRVVSGGVTVRVTGTVFTVERQEARTRVAVFEGGVAVAGGGPLSLLSAGDRWEGEPGRRLPSVGVPFEPRLSEEARWAAERRIEAHVPGDDFVPNLPEVPDLAADGRLPRQSSSDAVDDAVELPADETFPAPPSAAMPRVEDARALLTDRRYDEARRLADRALRSGTTADWLLIRGDALRGEGRLDEAAAEYTRATLVGDPRDRAVAGLSAARVLGRELGRATAAREVLGASGALAPSSPVREQAEALAGELGLLAP
jgi:ferric-dicitrate binding protein FerR (iron transport regulator)